MRPADRRTISDKRGPFVLRVDDVAVSADSLASALRSTRAAVEFARAMAAYLETGVLP